MLVAVAVGGAMVGVAVVCARAGVFAGAALATSRVITPVSRPVAEQRAKTNADISSGALRLLLFASTPSSLPHATPRFSAPGAARGEIVWVATLESNRSSQAGGCS